MSHEVGQIIVALLTLLLGMVGLALNIFAGIRAAIRELGAQVGRLNTALASIEAWRIEHDKRDDERFNGQDRRIARVELRLEGRRQ